MKALFACEESQACTIEYRAKGVEAYSADIQECSGGRPEWHIQGDVLEVLDDGWDLIVAFPPCTHLAVSGAAWFEEKRKDGRQQEGIDFFMQFVNAACDKIAIENPVGIMSTIYREPDQIIHPYYFGDPESKATCLWLKGLKPLVHVAPGDMFDETTHVEPEYIIAESSGIKYSPCHWSGGGTGEERSKTCPGIARAMTQWIEEAT